MAYSYKRGTRWYVGFRDERGRSKQKATKARTKTEADRLASDLERRAERIRLGIEMERAADMLLADAVAEYLASLGPDYRSKRDLEARFRLRILPHLKGRTVRSITPADVRRVLAANTDCAPQTREHLRIALQGAFTFFITGLRIYFEPNPAKPDQAGKVRVPKGEPRYLTAEDVRRLLAEIPEQWRPLCAVAVGTGLRKGELLALHRSDVRLDEGRIVVSRSHDSATTKGGRTRTVYFPDELAPVLRTQLEASRGSVFLFPNPDGLQWRADVKLNAIVRRALGRAGLVDGYLQHCRACRWDSEPMPKAQQVACPRCGAKTWPKRSPIAFRFKDLRSTWATHAYRATGNIRFVQAGLGHSDPRLTESTYSRVLDEHHRAQANAVTFGPVSPLQETQNESKPKQDKGENNRG